MRFREVVFLHNVANDDRFCNTPSEKSVISVPIIQAGGLLGVLYLVCPWFFLQTIVQPLYHLLSGWNDFGST